MSAQTYADPRAELVPTVPDGIESPEAKLVYVYLDASRTGATVDELVDHLGIKRLALFPVLDCLESRGLVDRDGPLYVAS
jgi:hypothetical protein